MVAMLGSPQAVRRRSFSSRRKNGRITATGAIKVQGRTMPGHCVASNWCRRCSRICENPVFSDISRAQTRAAPGIFKQHGDRPAQASAAKIRTPQPQQRRRNPACKAAA